MTIIKSLVPVSELGFGQYFCPHYVRAFCRNGQWEKPELLPYGGLDLDPAAKVLHYGQEIFEGLKVYKGPQGQHQFFRPQENFRRLERSAQILSMATVPEDIYRFSLQSLAKKCADLVPAEPGSLYLRPTLIGISPTLGVAPAKDYLYFLLASPVGGYFGSTGASGQPATVNVWISDAHVRAVRGGLGAAKAGANYAASLRAVAEAKSRGFSNVLFLDAIERKYLEELSGMNIFVVDKGVLKTPELGDTILAGITRDSILQLAAFEKIPVQEAKISVQELLRGLADGSVTEVFACGTGASITAVGELGWQNEKIAVGNKGAGPLTTRLFQKLCAIQFGREKSPLAGWIEEVRGT